MTSWRRAAINTGWEVYTTFRPKTRELGPFGDFEGAIQKALTATFQAFGGTGIWKHLKRGTRYEVIARGEVQCSKPIEEGSYVYCYVDENGKAWVRPCAEFEDGRFQTAD